MIDLMRMQAALFRSSVGRGAGGSVPQSKLNARQDSRQDARLEPLLHALPNARGDEQLAA